MFWLCCEENPKMEVSSPNSSCLTRAAPKHLKTRTGKQSSHSRGSFTAGEAPLTRST